MDKITAAILTAAFVACDASAYWPTVGLKRITDVTQSTFKFQTGAADHFWNGSKWLSGQDFCVMTEAALTRASYENRYTSSVSVSPSVDAQQLNRIPYYACYAVTNTGTWLTSVRANPCYAFDDWSGDQNDLMSYIGTRMRYWSSVSQTPITDLFVTNATPVSANVGKLTELRTATKKMNYKFVKSTGVNERGAEIITSITNGVGSAIGYSDFTKSVYVPIWGHYIAHSYEHGYNPPWYLYRLSEGRLDRTTNTDYSLQIMPSFGGESYRRYNLFYVMKRKVAGVPSAGTLSATETSKYVFLRVDRDRTSVTIPKILEAAGMVDDIIFCQQDSQAANNVNYYYDQYVIVYDVTGVGLLDISASQSPYIRLDDNL